MNHAEVTVARLRRLTGWTPSTAVADGIRATADFAAHRQPAGG
jgi:nucleoside-diphosphate-sugar epimerase